MRTNEISVYRSSGRGSWIQSLSYARGVPRRPAPVRTVVASCRLNTIEPERPAHGMNKKLAKNVENFA